MPYAAVTFSEIPRIGFAHHFRVESYAHKQTKTENSLEIVYVKEGTIHATVGEVAVEIPSGSVAVIPRTVPFAFSSADGQPNQHCSVQLKMPCRITLLSDGEQPPDGFCGLLLPLVLPPCAETESIKKDLYAIVSDIGISRAEREMTAAAAAMGILARLDQLQRQQTVTGSTASIWEYRIKQYIARHIHKPITLTDIAVALDKTPNYLNSVFHSATGSGIHRYINNEKVRLIAELLETREVSFKDACAAVAIDDVIYGYRLFKKHMGMTTRAYLSGEHRTE